MGKLKDRLREVYVGALGNKATLAGRTALLAGLEIARHGDIYILMPVPEQKLHPYLEL